ncbi:kinase-like domain-containing protein [Rhizophagus irregularis DAOM 181602=DAOM 197198]|nr:kinase-like domain-containing protein [Rhizophagus irregularis DAOM 181602=DAOM 197198]
MYKLTKLKSLYNKLIGHKNCSYCNKSFTKELWCKECDPFMNIERWSSGNNEIDKLIKDTIYGARNENHNFLEWVPFDKFKDINQIGEGGFSKVYFATWIDGPKIHKKYGIWEKRKSEPIKVALKRLNGSENISAEYLNEIKILWDLCQIHNGCLSFYGMTKDPETEELMIISEYADKGNLRSVISHNFNNTLWKDKLLYLHWITHGLKSLHELGYFHKDFHSGNILQVDYETYISDFGLSGPSNKQKSDDKICGVLPYIAPEVLNEEPYSLSSDIYSFGIIMVELSSGKPPFHKIKHDITLALEICNGLRPEFGKGTPEIYKKLAYKCMNANSNQRPTAEELYDIIKFWLYSNSLNTFENYLEKEEFGYKGKEIKAMFEEADKEIPNISTSYDKNPDAVYTSRLFTFSNLTKPVNSSIITEYLNDEENNKGIKFF